MVLFKKCLFLFGASVFLFPSVVDAQSFSPGTPLVVVDRNGAEIGHLMSEHTAIVIANDLAVSVEVSRRRLFADGGGWLFYPKPDCEGDAYFMARLAGGTPLAPGSTGPTGILFVAEYGSPTQITAQSWYRAYDEECGNRPQVVNNALPAVPTVNLETMFVPPFTVRPAPSTKTAGVPTQ